MIVGTGAAATSATAAVIDSRSVFPNTINAGNVKVAGTIGTTAAGRYPRATGSTGSGVPVVTVVLQGASFGYNFASGGSPVLHGG